MSLMRMMTAAVDCPADCASDCAAVCSADCASDCPADCASDCTSSSSESCSELSDADEAIEVVAGESYVINSRRGMVHLEGDDGKLRCNRAFPVHFLISPEWPEGMEVCSLCFRRR